MPAEPCAAIVPRNSLDDSPTIVIFDEPMSGLDPVGRREVRELILQLRDEGRTVLFSSHILSDAELLCSRVGILAKGRLVAAGTLGELTAHASRGWEVVGADVPEAFANRVRLRSVKVTDKPPAVKSNAATGAVLAFGSMVM